MAPWLLDGEAAANGFGDGKCGNWISVIDTGRLEAAWTMVDVVGTAERDDCGTLWRSSMPNVLASVVMICSAGEDAGRSSADKPVAIWLI
jgi:hypothetical protein